MTLATLPSRLVGGRSLADFYEITWHQIGRIVRNEAWYDPNYDPKPREPRKYYHKLRLA